MSLKHAAKFLKTLLSLPLWPRLSCAGIAAGRRPDKSEQVTSEANQLRAQAQRVLQEREEQLSLALRSSKTLPAGTGIFSATKYVTPRGGSIYLD